MRKSRVGIIGNSYLIDGHYPVQAGSELDLEAIASICDAVPLIIPSLPNVISISALLETFDGFLFTGARPNVHPEEYGEKETEAHGLFDRNRDQITLPLIRECVASSIPVFGICRGFQEFNVAFGGSLYPEIRDLPGRMNHRMPQDGSLEEKFAHRHNVKLDSVGKFEKILGASTVRVNSLHGQGIKQAGERIIIEGIAEDETPEAIHVAGAKGFAMAVQWHPEWQAEACKVSKLLFEAFGNAILERKIND